MRFAVLAISLLVSSGIATAALDDYYHNYDECYSLLTTLADDNPDIMRVECIGYSDEMQLPVWAAIISDNVQENEDEPAVLLTGTCHAEEILGTEVVLAFAQELMDHRNQMPWVAWIASSQIIIVPTYNPEGMGIVMSEEDVTYRKNLRHIGGSCTIHPGIGNDSCGVDLNRNYDFFWNHGDTLWHDQDAEAFDYYRGPYPFSEGEARAIRDLKQNYNLLYYIAYHSARTSTNFQKVIYPWGWKHPEDENVIKPCPDVDLMISLGTELANNIPTLDGTSTYAPVLAGGRKGSAHNYTYGMWGTISFLLEIGTNEDGGAFQPQDFDIINQIIDDNLSGVHWMMNRMIGYDDVPGPMLQGHVTDADSGQPLLARVEVLEHTSNEIRPRLTQMPWGRFYRVLAAGSYTVRISKPGYETLEQTLLVNPQEPTEYAIQLVPLPRWTVNGNTYVTSTETAVECDLHFYDAVHDTLYICPSDGSYNIELPTGQYLVTTDHPEHVLARRTLQVDQDLESNFGLPDNVTATTIPTDALDGWISEGDNPDWTIAVDDSANTHLVSNSSIYTHSNVDATLTLANPIDLSAYSHASLHLHHFIDLEDDLDYAELQASSNGSDWVNLAHYTGHRGGYRFSAYSVDQFAGGDFYLRLHLITDEWVNDYGWHINQIVLRMSEELNSVAPLGSDPERFTLLGNYPNPFNPSTTIEFSVPSAMTGERPELMVYNLLGARVAQLQGEAVGSGVAQMQWRAGSELSSGIYFYRLRLGDQVSGVGKLLLVK